MNDDEKTISGTYPDPDWFRAVRAVMFDAQDTRDLRSAAVVAFYRERYGDSFTYAPNPPPMPEPTLTHETPTPPTTEPAPAAEHEEEHTPKP